MVSLLVDALAPGGKLIVKEKLVGEDENVRSELKLAGLISLDLPLDGEQDSVCLSLLFPLPTAR